MHAENLHPWQHTHDFGQDIRRPGEVRTMIVVVVTATMMVVEITAGLAFGSMALLADGLHMASHAVALGLNTFAYIYARSFAHHPRFNFGTGKVNALGGFTGGVLLAGFALLMAGESFVRFFHPVNIAFNQAILVAIVGLFVNAVCVMILGRGDHQKDHHHEPGEEHTRSHQQDHNLRSAYLHVFADALTSVLAIVALLAAKYFGLMWMDPMMGIVGAILVARWSVGLLRTTGSILLDEQGPADIRATVKANIESHEDNRIADFHLWSIGPKIYAAIVSVVTHNPHPPDHYKKMIPSNLGLAHVTVEVNSCDGEGVS